MKVVLIILIVWLIINILSWSLVKPMHLRHNSIRTMLGEIHSACAKHQIRYWVCGGTLLGAYRDGNIIPWDDDADICIDEKDVVAWNTVVRETLDSKGVMSRGAFGGVDGRVYLRGDRTDAFVDVFYRHTDEDAHSVFTNSHACLLWGKKDWTDEVQVREENLVDYNMGMYTRDGQGYKLVVRGPSDPEVYLQRKFGTEWFVPVRTHFHSMNSYMEYYVCPTLVVVSLLILCIGISVQQFKTREDRAPPHSL
jgi:hypothetical protein